jgi:hypothetical protein
VDYVATQGKGFRELRVEETGKKPRAKAKETEDAFERPIPAGLPPDITPEEIAAITAAAARLKGAAPAAEATTPESVEQVAPEVLAAPAATTEEPAPVTFASAPDLQTAEAQNEVQSAMHDVQIAPADPVTEAQAGKVETMAEEAALAAEQVQALAEVVIATPVEMAEAQPAPPIAEVPQVEPPIMAAPAKMPVVADNTASEAVPPAPLAEVAAAPVAASAERPTPAPTAPPADDEVMAALQSLMPVAESMSGSSSGTNGSGKHQETSSAIASLAAQADTATMKAHAAGPRWIAEEVALGAGEATLSLEREMEQAYAAVAAGEPPRAAVEASAALPKSESETVAAIAEPLPEVPPAAAAQAEVVEQPAVYAMASAAGAGDATPIAAAVQVIPQDAAMVESAQAHPEAEVIAPVASSVPVDAPQAAAEIESSQAVAAPAPAPAPKTSTPEVQIPEIRILEAQIAEGADDMVANWKNIRDSIAGAAPKRAPSKEDIPVEPVKAEAEPVAAAPHDSAPSGAADPKAIASIVDSVLAELRPRIVEEIAKKLSGDTKKD